MRLLNAAMIVFSFTAAAIQGIGLRALGFCRPTVDLWGRSVAGGLVLGAVATLVILIADLPGLRARVRGSSFGSIVLQVWIVSSVSEEIFCRGWFQATTHAILPSALLFGALHLLLLRAGVDVASTLVIVAATTVLGLLAAWARARSGSLYPAIAAHVAFNVGGALAGIVYTIRQRVTDSRWSP